MNTKNEALELTQIDFGGDCDTPPEPWSAIWVAWNSEDGFTFWNNEKQAALWSAADNNEWPVQYAMQKAQPTPVQGPCGWQFYQDGKWHNGMETHNHRANTEAAGVPVRDVFPAAQPAPVQPVAWVGLERSDMPDGEDPMFDHPFFIKGMVYVANVLMKKNAAPEKGQP